jgi:prefoldin subunit 5
MVVSRIRKTEKSGGKFQEYKVPGSITVDNKLVFYYTAFVMQDGITSYAEGRDSTAESRLNDKIAELQPDLKHVDSELTAIKEQVEKVSSEAKQ